LNSRLTPLTFSRIMRLLLAIVYITTVGERARRELFDVL
jgi:hypothetical protein